MTAALMSRDPVEQGVSYEALGSNCFSLRWPLLHFGKIRRTPADSGGIRRNSAKFGEIIGNNRQKSAIVGDLNC
jgi:hypothetical protein